MTNTSKIIIFLISILIFGIVLWSIRIDIIDYFVKKNVIFWSENVEITPSDFQDEIDWDSENNEFWLHSLYLKSKNLKDAEVKAVFHKNKSWIKDTTDFNAIIKTEKLMFDLYESYARKFNKEINKIKHLKGKSYSDLEKIGDKIYTELLKVEDSIYDTDLPASEIVDFWKPKINRLLGKYK